MRQDASGESKGTTGKVMDLLCGLIPFLGIPLFFLVMFVVMPIGFRLGELVVGDRPPRVVQRGEVRELVLDGEETANRHRRATCRVYPEYVEIEGRRGEVVLVPRERVKTLVLDTD
jgi:hypothetical protein